MNTALNGKAYEENPRVRFGKSLASLLVLGASAALAATTAITSVSELGDSVTVGNDTLRYDGTGNEAYSGTFTAAPGDKLATTVSVSEPGACLKLPKVGQTNGGFVKTGPGELVIGTGGLTYACGEQGTYWGGTPAMKWTDGKCDPHYPSVVVHEGTLTFDFDKAQTSVMPDSSVGMPYNGSPVLQSRLVLESGILQFYNSLTIDRGTGRPGDHPLQSVRISTNGTLKASNLWLTTDNGSSDFCGNSLLDIDGGKAEVSGSVQIGRAKGSARILVRNGGTFASTASDLYSTTTMVFPNSTTCTNCVFELTDCATGKFYQVATLKDGEQAVFKVKNDAVLMLDRYRFSYLTNFVGGGVAEFDGGVVRSLTDRSVSDWFPFCEAYTVGPKGVVLESPILASLGGASRGPGTIVTRGGGEIALHPGAANVSVESGDLRLTSSPTPTLVGKAAQAGRITAPSGSVVGLSGADALGGMTLVAGEQEHVFRARGLESDALGKGEDSRWAWTGASMPRGDGRLKISYIGAGGGLIWRKDRVDVSRSFRLSLDYFPYRHSTATGAYHPYGCSVIFQNTPEGPAKTGDFNAPRTMGFGRESAKWPNAFAVGYDVAASAMRISRHDDGGNYFETSDASVDLGYGVGPITAAKPARITVRYDAVQHKVTFSVTPHDGRSKGEVSANVNLAERCGDIAAYLGFGGPNPGGNGAGEHVLDNIQLVYDDETPADAVAVGGTAEVASGKTFKATLDRDSRAKVWTLDALDHAAGSTVEIKGASDAVLGFGQFSGSGKLVKTGAGALGLMSSTYPLAGELEVRNGGLLFGTTPISAGPLAMTADNWWLATSVAAFEEGGIGVGRAGNAEPLFTDNANSLTRVKVNCPWTISYDLKISIIGVGGSYGFYSIYFQNDDRGSEAVGIATGNGAWNCVKGISKCAAVVFGGGKGQGSYNNANQVAACVDGTASGWTSTLPVQMGLSFSGNTTASTNGTVKLSYDPVAKSLRVDMTQEYAPGETNTFTKTFTNFDIPAAVGDDYAYLGFGANTAQNWFGIRQTVTNFRYEIADQAYVQGPITLAQANTEMRLDAAAAGRTMKLSNGLVAPTDATVKLTSVNDMTAADLGAMSCTGTLTIDGGVLAVGPDTLKNVRTLNLVNGAKLQVAPGVTVSIVRLKKDGVRVPAGRYTSDFVIGGGTVVSAPPGLIMVVR